MNEKIAIREATAVKKEAGTEIEVTEVVGKTEVIEAIGPIKECLDAMAVEMMMIGHLDGTEIFLKGVAIAAVVAAVMKEATATSSQCKWEVARGTRALARRPRRKSLHPT